MEFIDFFLKILVIILPAVLMGSLSKNFSFMLAGFSIGIVIGVQTNVLQTWWVTLSVLGLVGSIFFGRGES